MLRRILTALALITGFASTGAPAQAAMAEAISAQAQSGDRSSQSGQSQDCECVLQRGLDAMKTMPPHSCTLNRKLVVIYIPTVQFGADRAFE